MSHWNCFTFLSSNCSILSIVLSLCAQTSETVHSLCRNTHTHKHTHYEGNETSGNERERTEQDRGQNEVKKRKSFEEGEHKGRRKKSSQWKWWQGSRESQTTGERSEVKGETGTGGQSCRLDGKCAEHSSGSLQPFQFTESLENRMNDWSSRDRREEIQRGDEKKPKHFYREGLKLGGKMYNWGYFSTNGQATSCALLLWQQLASVCVSVGSKTSDGWWITRNSQKKWVTRHNNCFHTGRACSEWSEELKMNLVNLINTTSNICIIVWTQEIGFQMTRPLLRDTSRRI